MHKKIDVKRTPISDVIKPEVISSRSAVLQPPRLSVLETLSKQNNNNNSNTNNNTSFSIRVPQITLNAPKTVSQVKMDGLILTVNIISNLILTLG